MTDNDADCDLLLLTFNIQQMQSGIRRGLGLIGASKRYTVFTPSMTNNEDLSILASLMREGKMVPVVSKVCNMQPWLFPL